MKKISIREYCRLTAISHGSVYNALKDGRLPKMQREGVRRFWDFEIIKPFIADPPFKLQEPRRQLIRKGMLHGVQMPQN